MNIKVKRLFSVQCVVVTIFNTHNKQLFFGILFTTIEIEIGILVNFDNFDRNFDRNFDYIISVER
jgi:hypothetical protein